MEQPKKKKVQVDLPDYRPPSFRTLWQLLGENDAGLEWIEVAIRQLLEQHTEGGATATNALAAAYAVRVHDLVEASLQGYWAKLQIGAVARYLEMFLDDFRKELPRDFRKRESKEDLLSYTLDVYKIKKTAAGELQFDLLTYYRKVRNRFTHESSAEDSKKLSREAAALREVIAQGDSPYKRLEAPNAPEEVGFDDFILFTRALKDFAKGMCAAVEVSDEEIRSRLSADLDLKKSLKKHNRPERRAGFLANYIRLHIGFQCSAESTSQRLLDAGLLAQW